jgi:hypothetical protein
MSSAARNMFQEADTRGKTSGTEHAAQAEIKTIHKNNILCYQLNLAEKEFSTSGVDGTHSNHIPTLLILC